MNTALLIIGIAVVGVGTLLLYLHDTRGRRFTKAMLARAKKVDVIMMADVASFFKKTEIIEHLREHENAIAVAMKETLKEKGDGDETIAVAACLFDKASNRVVDFEEKSEVWKSAKLDDELTAAFGDKDMLVLQ